MQLKQQLQTFAIATKLIDKIQASYEQLKHNPQACWKEISKVCFQPRLPFPAVKYLYEMIYKDVAEPHPVWFPNNYYLSQSNIAKASKELNYQNYKDFFQWSITKREAYWQYAINKLQIKFNKPFEKIVNLSDGITQAKWLPGAKFNIIDSCFQAEPNKIAIIYGNENDQQKTLTYAELEILVNRIANSIHDNFNQGDVIAIAMPMNIEAVAIYLGIIKAGCVVASIADSFAPAEIAIRLKITNAKAIFTQDYSLRAGKKILSMKKLLPLMHLKLLWLI